MNKSIALLPILILMIPGLIVTTRLATANLEQFSTLFAVLIIAIAINGWMMIHHRRKQANRHR